jgi:hypothetical protein
VVGVEELAAIVVEVEAKVAVVMEEGVVLRRGSLVLAPSEEKSTVVLVPPPSVPILHQQHPLPSHQDHRRSDVMMIVDGMAGHVVKQRKYM